MADNRQDSIIKALQERGWGREQAIGIAANLQAESGFDPNAFNPAGGGQGAQGIAQWRGSRLADFQAQYGKPLKGSSLDEQLDFLTHELLFGKEQKAGKALVSAKTSVEAADIVSRQYERHDDEKSHQKRAATAAAWGGESYAQGTMLPKARQGVQEAPERDADWPLLPTARGGRQTAPGAAKGVEGLPLMAEAAAFAQQGNTTAGVQEAEDARQAGFLAEQKRKDAVGIGQAWEAARRDTRNSGFFTVMNALTQEAETQPLDYMENIREIEKPCATAATDDCVKYMRENVRGRDTMQRAHGEWAYREDLDRTYGDAGTVASMLSGLGAGALDPVGFAAGGGFAVVGKAYHASRIARLAAQGMRPSATATAAAVLAEGALGNVAFEGIQDALGEVKGTGDYVMAAAMGAAFASPFAVGAHRMAVNDAVLAYKNKLDERATIEQMDALVKAKADNPGLDDAALARVVERNERTILDEHTNTDTGSAFQKKAVPDSVERQIRDEYEGRVVAEDVAEDGHTLTAKEKADIQAELDAENKTKPPTTGRAEKPPSDEELNRVLRKGTASVEDQNKATVEAVGKGKEVDREIVDGTTKVTFGWHPDRTKEMGKRNNTTVREVLDTIKKAGRETPALQYLRKALGSALDAKVKFTAEDARSQYSPKRQAVTMAKGGKESNTVSNGNIAAALSLEDNVKGLSRTGLDVLAHEIAHAATTQRVWIWQEAKKAGTTHQFTKAEKEILEGMDDLYERFVAQVKGTANEGKEYGPGYAAKNIYEFMAQAFNDKPTQMLLNSMPGKRVAGKGRSMLLEFVAQVKKALGLTNRSALDETYKRIDNIITMDTRHWEFDDGTPVMFAPGADNGQLPPAVLAKMQKRWADEMYAHATSFTAENPIDTARLATLTASVNLESAGLVLARAQNPILRMLATLVTETTTGAAGRQKSVAIRAPAIQKKIIGNFRPEYEGAYSIYRDRMGGGVMEDVLKGNIRRKFDREVYIEVYSRQKEDYVPTASAEVRAAADAVEKPMTRALDEQVQANTLGSAYLPNDSKGYIPQALDGAKLATMSVEDMALFHREISRQVQTSMGWNKKLADDFAPRYTERVRLRGMGDKQIDMMAAGGDTGQIIRQTLEEMGYTGADPELQALARQDRRGGLSQTKRRTQIDMSAELRPGLSVMDFYVTDVDKLVRTYARRTSGTVALTEVGIHGWRGADQLRSAVLRTHDKSPVSPRELAAFDQVIAEVLGTPVAGAVVSAGATNLRLLVGLQRLGGLVWTQAAEAYNMTHHVGLRSTMAGIASLPRMLGEVSRLKKGGELPRDHLMWSVEQIGGEIGMEHYKMVAPLDAPDHALGAYMDNPGLTSRLLRAGGHLQSKLSGFRGLMAAQHRMAAEQITLKAMRFIRDGDSKSLRALEDMGFTKELRDAMREELPAIAKWDNTDALQSLDLTLLSDPRLAESFVAAVHRGTSQIIQGTFAGERSLWMHNDWVTMLAQLRTFGFTASEKQWGRTRMNHGDGPLNGYGYAAGLVLGQVALTLPLHLARVHTMSAGREDREQYIKDNTSVEGLTKALMNYSSMSGMAGDVIEAAFAVTGGLSDDAKEFVGGRSQPRGIANIIPAAGSIDQALKVVQGSSSLYQAAKQAPMSSLWWLVPLVNTTKKE